jgi:multidrug efflux pump subunit AcrA (membrane-fusion protein)
VTVPDAAVQLVDERAAVFVIVPDEDGGATFERRDVEVGTRSGDRAQILTGLQPGDVVVIEGAFAVKSEFARSRAPVE